MITINLNLDDSQLALIYTANKIAINPEIDFVVYLQSQIDDRLLPLYADYVKKTKLETAAQMIDFDIVNKVQDIIDVVKLDKDADYTITKKNK